MNNTLNAEMYSCLAVETSAMHTWPGLQVERYQLEAKELPAHFYEQHLLIIHHGEQPVHSRRQSGSRGETALFSSGDAGLYFERTTGLSPYQYVLSWKIRRARQLLRADELPIAVISDLLGFASPAHFSAVFKGFVGQSPREFQTS